MAAPTLFTRLWVSGRTSDFAAACGDAGLTFIGPNSRAMAMLGGKTEARRTMLAAGVPVSPAWAVVAWRRSGLRVAVGIPGDVEAAAGGGGKACALSTRPMSSRMPSPGQGRGRFGVR